MKIAVASEGKMVTGHFGHCEGFNIFTVQEGRIADREFVSNPGHKPGFLPNYLNDLGVNVIIAGGMGDKAAGIFKEKAIQVVTGAAGDAEDNARRFLEGTLKSDGSVCHEHSHKDGCEGH